MTEKRKFPISHIVSYLLSVGLTILAVYFALGTNLERGTIMTIIGSFAVIQAGMQLFMFMNMTEGRDGWMKVTHTIYAIAMAVIFVIGTYYVMTAGHPIM
mgnify:CR=1 FL=1